MKRDTALARSALIYQPNKRELLIMAITIISSSCGALFRVRDSLINQNPTLFIRSPSSITLLDRGEFITSQLAFGELILPFLLLLLLASYAR